MRSFTVAFVLCVLLAINIESGECILGSICKKIQAVAKKYAPAVKEHLYKTVCDEKKCKQPMRIPLIEKYLEEKFREIFNHVVPKIKALGIKLHKDITPDKLVALAREFEHCPKLNGKANLCHFDMKKDKAVVDELTKKAIEKGMPLAMKMMSEASKCDKAAPLVDDYLHHKWETGKGDAPDVKAMINKAFDMWCK